MLKETILLAVFASVAFAATLPSGVVIKSGFEYIGNAEGKIFVKAILNSTELYGVTWQRAIEICANSGYKMALITSKAQDDVVRRYGEEVVDSKRWMWIDGTNFVTNSGNRTWFSINTGKNLEYFNWVRGRPVRDPSPSYNPQCLRWSANGMQENGWWDVQCDDRHNVLCEETLN